MKVIIDAMSGDNAPLALIEGASLARKEFGANVILVGDEKVINRCAEEHAIDLSDMEIVHASDVVTMEDSPLAVKEKKDSSMRIAFALLNEGKGDAFVGAGNTGAMHIGSTLFVRRIPGVRRSALAAILPLEKPVLLLDAGANISVTEHFLLQFAIMGSVYMNKMYGIKKPRVGLLNNGTEAHKGTELYVKTHQLLAASEDICFVGNIEGKEIPFDTCDVLVCDGFSGNIALKSIEGMGVFVMKKVKSLLTSSFRTKIAALLCKNKMYDLKRRFDTSEHGGAPFLGISSPIIKAHGSSDARAIRSTVRQAIAYYETGITKDIADYFTEKSPI